MRQVHGADRGHDNHRNHRDRVERFREPERRLRHVGQHLRQQDAFRAARDECDAPQDPHRAKGNDERMHAQTHNHEAIHGSADQTDAHCHHEAGGKRSHGSRGAHRAQRHRGGHARQRVDRSYGQVDPARNDHHRRAHGHDREEARVGGGLDQRVEIQKIVDGLAGQAIHVRSREQRQQRTEQHDHEDEAGLLRSKDPANHRAVLLTSSIGKLMGETYRIGGDVAVGVYRDSG